MRSFSGIGRIAAVGAVIAAAALVALLLFGDGGGGYKVKARFINAGQLVKGNPVQTGGVPIGSVDGIEIAPNGEAELTLEIDQAHAPLRRGTQAAIRQFSQSGIANRYVDLSMPPNGSREIPDGATIGSDDTTTQVDLDQLFNTLDDETRANLQKFFKGSAEMLRWLVYEHGIEPHVTVFDKSARRDGTFSREDFAYDRERDVYVCPAGKTLTTRGTLVNDGATLLYRALTVLPTLALGLLAAATWRTHHPGDSIGSPE